MSPQILEFGMELPRSYESKNSQYKIINNINKKNVCSYNWRERKNILWFETHPEVG